MRVNLVTTLFAASIAACGGGADSPTAPAVDSTSVSSVTVTPANPTIAAGATQTFSATAKNAQGKTLTTTTFTWQSSSTSTATITGAGVATGAAAGTTTITATGGGKTGTTTLTVNAPPAPSWTTKTDMPTGRQMATAAVVNGIIYVIGGLNFQVSVTNPHLTTVEAYDPATNTWTTKAPMPGARSALQSAVVNGVIYVFGGDNAVSTGNSNAFSPLVTVQAYDPATNTWTTKASMTLARERFAIAESGGIIYVLGGFIPSGSAGNVATTNTMHAYTVSTNAWSTKASMNTARNDFTAVALNGVIYAMSGQSSSTVEAYDIATNTWTNKASLTQINSQPIGSFTASGLVYAMNSFPFIESYSPASNVWTAKTGVTNGFSFRNSATLSIVGTTMYVIGGRDSFSELKTVEARIIP